MVLLGLGSKLRKEKVLWFGRDKEVCWSRCRITKKRLEARLGGWLRRKSLVKCGFFARERGRWERNRWQGRYEVLKKLPVSDKLRWWKKSYWLFQKHELCRYNRFGLCRFPEVKLVFKEPCLWNWSFRRVDRMISREYSKVFEGVRSVSNRDIFKRIFVFSNSFLARLQPKGWSAIGEWRAAYWLRGRRTGDGLVRSVGIPFAYGYSFDARSVNRRLDVLELVLATAELEVAVRNVREGCVRLERERNRLQERQLEFSIAKVVASVTLAESALRSWLGGGVCCGHGGEFGCLGRAGTNVEARVEGGQVSAGGVTKVSACVKGYYLSKRRRRSRSNERLRMQFTKEGVWEVRGRESGETSGDKDWLQNLFLGSVTERSEKVHYVRVESERRERCKK